MLYACMTVALHPAISGGRMPALIREKEMSI